MTTLATPLEKSGIGLHSGETAQVRVLPGNPGDGRYFVRTDLADIPVVPANLDTVRQTQLCTELVTDTAKVRTVEHLLAALSATGIEDARIEIDGEEVPLLDGSAKEWVEAIQASVSAAKSPHTAPAVKIDVPLWLYDGDAFVAALPSPERRLSYGIDFESRAIGNQWHSWSPDREDFATEIAPARTFGLAHQVEYLRSTGLIKGGSLENALVCDRDRWLNPPLRFVNEPVRHKILDLVGDLSLLGSFPIAHFIAYKASHSLHTQFARKLRSHLTERAGAATEEL
ncbi:MAG: UDP-3-O-acyl-N-acetylglucosamine deacetylase [Cyanobacteriota bacterium]|nr:UDP-3-O-acyl-N-acetylglucosamine deacetylase [Cyanobacteriota bacterium]